MSTRTWIDALKSRFLRILNRHERRASARRGPAARGLKVEDLEGRSLLAVGLAADFPVGIGPQAALATDFSALHGNPHDYDSTRILVRFRPNTGPAAAVEGTHLARELSLVPGLHSVRLDAGMDVAKALDAYRADPNVLYASPNYLVHALGIPNDPGYVNLWGLNNTEQTGGTLDADIDHAELAFQGNGSTVVAIIDTGIDYNHPDLAGNIWTNFAEASGAAGVDDDGNGYVDDIHGYDFVNNDGDPMDDFFHGTHVAGTIGAVANNGIGVAGVNWDVQLMAVKFLDAGGSGTLEGAVLAIQYVAANHVPISNNSWGGGGFFPPLYDAIAAAGAQGHLFVAAAGNYGVDTDLSPDYGYPAAYDLDNIVSVAATDHNDLLASFSNYGATSVDLGAPGADIYSTFPTYMTQAMIDYGLSTDYETISGTSMATPHVAGVAALVRDLHPTWGYQEIKDVLLATVDPIDALDGITVSGGRLNAYAAATGTPPPDTTGPRVNASTPSGVVLTPATKLRVSFNEPVVNFDLPDIASFTGPGGAITPLTVTPVDGSGGRQYDITFASQTAEGGYTMLIGPGDVQDASGNLMDQDRDGVRAEATDDQYTATFTIDYFPGPDDYGYEAHPIGFESIDLVFGEPGVFAILDDVDDGYAGVDLGGNTFTFYGVDYSGASLFISPNGLITLGDGVADYANTDLSGSPDVPAIAPLWDDWVTYVDAVDEVLGKFDGNRLIIEWSVYHFSGSPWPVTFQAILGLNAGGPADPIVFNYPNLDTGDGTAEGQSATVGIKDSGAQGPNRLLVSADTASPYFGTGQALRIAVEPLGPALRISDAGSVTEGDGPVPTEAVFTVTLLNPPTDATVTVNYATGDGSGTADSDYQSNSGTLTFTPGTPGATSQTITVLVSGDVVYEPNETFVVNLSSPSGAVLSDGQGTATILNDDPAPLLAINDQSVVEGDGGTTSFVFTVTLINAAAGQSVTVDYATADGSGTAGSDYQAVPPGTLTFASGETSKTITVLINGDSLNEAHETFFVNLSSPVGAVLADGQGVATILNDDPVPELAINDWSVLEGNSGTKNLVFTVSLSVVSGQTITVNYLTANGTATAGDYQTASGTLTIPAGQASGTITVLVNGDRLPEPEENFFVNLSAPASAVITDGQGVGTISDNEPRISINDVSLQEGRNGRLSLVFTITLSTVYDQAVTMSFRTVNGTANGSDYVAKSGTLTFAPGETTKTITIEVKGDSKKEADETFFLDLFNLSSNALFTKNRGFGTILNDD